MLLKEQCSGLRRKADQPSSQRIHTAWDGVTIRVPTRCGGRTEGRCTITGGVLKGWIVGRDIGASIVVKCGDQILVAITIEVHEPIVGVVSRGRVAEVATDFVVATA
jgi:hypothetical protein